MKFLKIIPLLIGFVTSTCPDIKSVEDFDFEKITGHWYTTHQTEFYDCATFTITRHGPFSIKTVFKNYNSSISSIQHFNETDLSLGFIDECPDVEQFHNSNGKFVTIDYDNYLAYAVCLRDTNSIFITLASRKPQLRDEDYGKIKNLLSENYQVDISSLKVIRHDICD